MALNTIYVKNMVCNRCIRVVKEELESLGYKLQNIQLGEVSIDSGKAIDLNKIREVLAENGFELLEDKKVQLINQIKTLIIDTIHHKILEDFNKNYSDFISQELGKDYTYLSHLFSTQEGITIEKYIIMQKIERVKELLVYDELTLSEISYKMNYSSVAHLSGQFKQVTGLTPTQFKQNHDTSARKSLDKV
ncbi:MAG: helix-turn-helix domain-containing protein [Bacteroidia bacterium]